jgi:hypothetical protein
MNKQEERAVEIAEEYLEWLNENDSYIRGVYDAKGFHKNGGWNGMMDAKDYTMKKELTAKERKRYNNCMYSTAAEEAWMNGTELNIDIHQSEIDESRGD